MKIPPKARLSLVAALLIATAAAPGPVSAQSAPPLTADLLVQQVVSTLRSAQSLRSDFEEIDSYPGNYKDLKQQGSIAGARPDQLSIMIRRYRRVNADQPWAASGNDTQAVSDGQSYWYAFLHPHSTQVRQVGTSPAVLEKALSVVAPVVGFYTLDTSVGLPEQSGPPSLGVEQSWEGAEYRIVNYPVLVSGVSFTATAYIGSDSLIHRLIYASVSDSGTVSKEWQLHNLVINTAVPSSEFAYVPRSDVFPLDTTKRPPLLATGTAAPDFTVYNSDGRPVKLSDYRGKTVILDFWATWCWPCNQSLPHTERVGEEYKSQDVVILAVAIWDSKTGFDLWLRKHDYPAIQFAFDPQPQGKDAASSLYNVVTTPTAYVIGPDGNIVKSIVGYTGPAQDLELAVKEARLPYTPPSGS